MDAKLNKLGHAWVALHPSPGAVIQALQSQRCKTTPKLTWNVESKAVLGWGTNRKTLTCENNTWTHRQTPCCQKWKQLHWNAPINNIVQWNHNINKYQFWNWKKWATRNYSADWGLFVASSTSSSDSEIIDWDEVKTFCIISVIRGDASQT